MGRTKKGRCVRKNKQIDTVEKDELVKAPHSFVIHRGTPGRHIVELTKDFRKVMEPFTASDLKERKRNTIKDFVSVAGVFHVTNMSIFTQTENGMYLKLCRVPRGPTLTFNIVNFALARDVISTMKKQLVFEEAFKHSPLIILNKFSGEGMQLKLMASMFQNMFPTINLATVNLSNLRRCVCLNYDPETKLIDFRHYAIKIVPVGLSRGVKKLVQAKIPNLARCEDFSDFMTQAPMSESEAEDDPASHVTLTQKLSSRGNHEQSKSAIRLSELGPRLTLQLIKVEDGLMEGEVLYHELVSKTEEEKLLIQKKRDKKRKLKEKRKKAQEENKKKKEDKKQELKEKSLVGIKKKKENDILMKKYAEESAQATKQEEDDDAQYYREEVGEEPDKELFQGTAGNKRPRSFVPRYKTKKMKLSTDKAKRIEDQRPRKEFKKKDGQRPRKEFKKK